MGPKDKKASFDEGLTAQMRGDLDTAIAIFERVVKESPGNAAAHHQLGRCQMKLGDFQGALEEIETAIRLSPDRIAARLDLGALYLAIGDTAKAKVQFMRALNINESNVKAMAGLGAVYYREEDVGKAISQLQSACTLNPSNFLCHFYLAKIHKGLKNPGAMAEEALKSGAICQGLIRTRPEQPEGYYFLAQTFEVQEEHRPALQNYLIAKDFSPKGVLHFFAFGLHYSLADNYLGIARCYEALGERRYARYFGQLTLKIEPENEQAERFASIED
jgi:tetratricopeptide (TPR) repeat protein